MTTTFEFVTLPEAARRITPPVCARTLARKAAKAGLKPDGILIEGTSKRRSPLFLQCRLGELSLLIHLSPVIV